MKMALACTELKDENIQFLSGSYLTDFKSLTSQEEGDPLSLYYYNSLGCFNNKFLDKHKSRSKCNLNPGMLHKVDCVQFTLSESYTSFHS